MPSPTPVEPLGPLLARVRACTICAEHLPHGPRPVFQLGEHAPILIAGQAPGRRVHASGKPFDDPSGQRLRDWLGVTPEQFYDPACFAILPMGFCYPGTGRAGDLPPRPECAQTWRESLLGRLRGLRLTLVIGQYALNWHLGPSRQNLTERVRDWRSHWPDTLLLPHPSPRNNRWLKTNPWFEAEVIPALREHVSALLGDQVPRNS